MVILGNKSDLKEKREVTEEELKDFAEKFNSTAMLTSAKTGENVEKAFSIVLEKMIASLKSG